jgi:hypothetical protein
MKLIQKFLNGTYEESNKFILFLFAFCLIFICSFLQKTQIYMYDSGQYYELSKAFGFGFNFTPNLFFAEIRGYFFPFLLNIVFRIFRLFSINYYLAYLIFSSAFFAFLITRFLPQKIISIFSYPIKNKEILMFLFMTCLFWSGYFQYTLTDFYSAFFIIISFILIKSERNYDYFIAGLAAAAAINARPSYLFCYFFLFVLLIYSLIKERKLINLFLKTTVFLVGSTIVFSPQIYYNSKYINSYSPFVPQKISMVGYSDIKIFHLDGGLKAFKYETLNDFKKPKVFYYIPSNLEVISRSYKVKTTKDYIKIVLTNPIKVSCIYALHFIAGIFQSSNQIYIDSFKSNFIFYVILNGLFFYLLTYFLLKNRKVIKKQYFFEALLLVLVSVITVIPTIVETRYFLLFHLFAYMFVAYSISKFERISISKKLIYMHLILLCTFLTLIYFSFDYLFSLVKIEGWG